MDIKNVSANNFKGAFVLKPATPQIREAIPNIIPKGRQIFRDIKSCGDVVIVTKDKYDKKVGDFVKSEGVPFCYYPEISTKSGLDDQIPEKLRQLIRVQNNCVVRNLKLLGRFLPVTNLHLSKQSEYLQEAINTLRLNTENARIQIDDNGVFFVRDEAKKRTIKSTGFRSGMAYIYIRPDDVGCHPIRRFLVSQNGKKVEKVFETPEEWGTFNKAFLKAIES